MRTRTTLGVTLLLAAAAVVVVTGGALGRNLSFRPSERGFKLAFPSFQLHTSEGVSGEEREATIVVSCPATLEGTFAGSSFLKIRGTQYASITRATMTEASCRGTRTSLIRNERGEWVQHIEGIAAKMHWLTATLPWHLEYQSFQGLLPAITAIKGSFVGLSVRVDELLLGEECLFGGTDGEILVIERTGVVRSIIGEEAGPALERRGELLCRWNSTALYSGQGSVTQSDGVSAVSLRLI